MRITFYMKGINMKLLAFYLPQYHTIPENDKWWGKGFTEWTNVKKTKPLFKNQTQPKTPLNNNYYNLLDKSTVEWQTNLMKKYGIYGFCYFHYWFNGKKLLEKPAENLLKWTDIEQPFCFAWANVTWARTWTAVKGAVTTWVSSDTKKGEKAILIEQTYGKEENWKEHYNYLRQFFKDKRYIKIDNKPMFLIYHLEDIVCAKEMFALWNILAVRDGFSGIHLVSINEVPKNNEYIEAIARYGNYSNYDPHFLRQIYNSLIYKLKLPFRRRPNILNYERVWRNIIKEKPIEGVKNYLGAVVSYDETPRKGRQACFIAGATPTIFEKYLKLQIEKAEKVCRTEYMFIDAWNEWGEGNYLEPDTEHQYAYLEAIKNVLK